MKLTEGLHCKACDKPLSASRPDPELCEECLGVVVDCNRDIIDKLTDEEMHKDATSEVSTP